MEKKSPIDWSKLLPGKRLKELEELCDKDYQKCVSDCQEYLKRLSFIRDMVAEDDYCCAKNILNYVDATTMVISGLISLAIAKKNALIMLEKIQGASGFFDLNESKREKILSDWDILNEKTIDSLDCSKDLKFFDGLLNSGPFGYPEGDRFIREFEYLKRKIEGQEMIMKVKLSKCNNELNKSPIEKKPLKI